MEKSRQMVTLLCIVLMVGCSIDAKRSEEFQKSLDNAPEVKKSTVCYSCTARDGGELEICDDQNGRYTIYHKGVKMKTIEEDDLEGKTPQKFVADGCSGLLDFES